MGDLGLSSYIGEKHIYAEAPIEKVPAGQANIFQNMLA